MKPGKLDFTIYQGSTFELPLRWGTTYDYIDLTGVTAKLQIRESLESPVVILELTTENGGITLGDTVETKGKITLYLEAAATSALDFDKGFYHLELYFPRDALPDRVDRILEGEVVLSKEFVR